MSGLPANSYAIMKRKRFSAWCIAAFIVLSLTACYSDKDEEIPEGTMLNTDGGTMAESVEEINYAFEKEKISADIVMGTEEHSVVGMLYRPVMKEKCPLIVVSHGFNGYASYYFPLCQAFAEAGIAALAIDYYGGSTQSLSGGAMEEMTVFTEQADLEGMLDVLKKLDYIDTGRICLFGHSQGGFVSTLTASARPEEIKALYLLAPAFMIPDYMTAGFDRYEDIAGYQSGTATVGTGYIQAVYQYDIYETMKGYTGKVHIYHGTSDEAVPMEYSIRAAETFENATLTKVEGLTHNYYDVIQEELIAEVIQDLRP
jgi:pimeloyl-ACP methyl ester carboxylesterase